MTRYELLERIGAGRVAEIFRGKAIAAGGFEKPVAIKRILPHLSQDPRFVEALIAEAKILSALRHRNIVQIFDVGLGDDGQYFLVMEYVEGVDLGALQVGIEARRQRLPIDLVLHIGAEVCEALEHAQVTTGPDGRPMRLVHRDVTPSNVLVSRAGEVKLTDFGLAKRPDDGTHTGGLKGRYGYVSPEQASGLPVDARSDVFAVGVIMWELAAGRRLFSGLADFDALQAVRESTIGGVRELVGDVPEELDAILAEALAKDPRKRLPSAGELGKRLRGLRYSLESSTGDPSAALARLVVTTQKQGSGERDVRPATVAARGKASGRRNKPSTGSFETTEPTIVRIRTADGFAQQDKDGSGLVQARRVIDRFEEEETRLAHLPVRGRAISEDVTGDAARARRDSGEVTTTAPPLHLGPETGEHGEITVSGPPVVDAERRGPDRRPRGAPAGARLDKLPAAAAKGPGAVAASRIAGPRAGSSAVMPPSPPPATPSGRDATTRAGSPDLPTPSPSPSQSSPGMPRTPQGSPRPSPVFGGAAAPPGTPPPRREPTGVRRDPSAGRLATPTTPQNYQPPAPRVVSTPPVAGFSGAGTRKWWPIIAGAAVIAVVSFVITRAVLSPGAVARSPAGASAIDAGLGTATDAMPAADAGTSAGEGTGKAPDKGDKGDKPDKGAAAPAPVPGAAAGSATADKPASSTKTTVKKKKRR